MSNDLSLWGADNGSFEKTTPTNLTKSENQKSGIVPVGSSLSNISIRDMLSGVKDTDGNYYFQSEVTNTQFEKSITTLGKMLGNEIRFFDGPAEFNGANRDGCKLHKS